MLVFEHMDGGGDVIRFSDDIMPEDGELVVAVVEGDNEARAYLNASGLLSLVEALEDEIDRRSLRS